MEIGIQNFSCQVGWCIPLVPVSRRQRQVTLMSLIKSSLHNESGHPGLHKHNLSTNKTTAKSFFFLSLNAKIMVRMFIDQLSPWLNNEDSIDHCFTLYPHRLTCLAICVLPFSFILPPKRNLHLYFCFAYFFTVFTWPKYFLIHYLFSWLKVQSRMTY